MTARTWLPALGAALLLAPTCSLAQDTVTAISAARPKVGLVLGGGGARGAAHVGVLEVLEELRVPVDCVAGTSMGALVAGAWAAGLSPARMREELAKADWDDMFQDDPAYDELNFRNKRLSQRFLPGSEFGIKDGSAVAPPGVVLGQKIKLFFNHLVRADTGEPEIERLPLPVSIIATDIGTGERVVYRDGSLTAAMRASMSVPGLMAPLEYRGRKLVDGGLVDNLPIREVRERCGAQVVIAVNVGSSPLRPEQVSGLLSVTAQVVALLTEQNVSTSLATLSKQDIYIKPELGDLTAGDFSRHATAADLGHEAALAAVAQLQRLQVPPETYAAWQQRMAVGDRVAPRVDEVQVAGQLLGHEGLVRRYVNQLAGQPLDTTTLTRDLLRVYGDGYYERVDYSVLRLGGRNVLRLLPVEKSWGPDYLRLGLRLDTSLSQGSSYQLRLGYQKTWLNTLGGELLATAELGSTTGAGVELYQPLVASQRYFAEALVDHQRGRTDYFEGERRLSEYRSARSRLEVGLGVNFSLLGQVRLSWRQTQVSHNLETGQPVPRFEQAYSGGAWVLGLDMDQLDRLHFPRRGWSTQLHWLTAPNDGYARAALDLRGAYPWQQQQVVAARLSWVGSPQGQLPVHDAARLGGFLNLTGFASGQLLGDEALYGHLRLERIIGRPPLGLSGDLRLGVALELARVAQPYAPQRRQGTLYSLALYLGGESPVGPMYLGIGQGNGRSFNAYLFIGTP
jgi:NTE family protein